MTKSHENKSDDKNDVWERFRRAVHAAAESGPMHKVAQKPADKKVRPASKGRVHRGGKEIAIDAAIVAKNFPLLPKEHWKFRRYAGGIIAAGIYDNQGHRHWVKIAESDLPNDLVSVEDLERFIVDPVHVAAV